MPGHSICRLAGVVMADEIGKAYTVYCSGKAIKTFKTREAAEAYRAAVIDEPALFLRIDEWEPGIHLPYVDFEEDKDGQE